MDIDYERLRKDLMDEFGTATLYFGVAYMDVMKIERASEEELLSLAKNSRIDLRKYKKYDDYER